MVASDNVTGCLTKRVSANGLVIGFRPIDERVKLAKVELALVCYTRSQKPAQS